MKKKVSNKILLLAMTAILVALIGHLTCGLGFSAATIIGAILGGVAGTLASTALILAFRFIK